MSGTDNHTTPPHWPVKFLRFLLKDEYLEEIEGDMEERFYDNVEQYNLKKASRLYAWDTLKLLRPKLMRGLKRDYRLNHTAMFKHNLLITYRGFLRNKSSFFINLVGLSTGLACALFIYLWVSDELIVDKFHKHDHRLYQALINRFNTNGVSTERATPAILATSLADELPEVEQAVASTSGMTLPKFTLTAEDKSVQAEGQFAGKDFFRLFSYDLIGGAEADVLADKSSIVISQNLAHKLFNTTENVVGKVVEWNLFGTTRQAIVTGIVKNVPPNSTDQFDFLVPFEIFKALMGPGADGWGATAPSTFLLLQEGTNLADFQTKVAGFIQSKEPTANTEVLLRPYSNRYLYNNFENGVQAGGRIEYVRLFSIIAIFILTIACINFMNLFTAKAWHRMKEIGVKKTVGAGRKLLIVQYLSESLLLAFLSLLMASALVVLFLPQLNQITGKQLTLSLDSQLIIAAFVITILTGLVAGSYPALYLSNFSPITVLKGKLNSSVGEIWTRKGLVIFQFVISVVLIVSIVVVHQQIAYVQSKNLGYDQDQVIYFDMNGSIQKNLNTFLSEVRDIPGIIHASSTTHRFTGHQSKTSGLNWEGKNPDDIIEFEIVEVSHDLFETLDIELQQGRAFSQDYRTDSTKIIFNSAAIKAMGLQDPVGKVITLWGVDRELIGVTKDFHFQSLHEPVTPLFFVLAPERTNQVVVKIEAGREQETIAGLQEFYQRYGPRFAFDYQFMEQTYQTLYTAEQRVSTLSKYFGGLAIIISCLGLFGLTSFTAERRLKEIGIRKVLGASTFGIIRLLSYDFTKTVLAAILMALPIGYFISQRWLEGFAFSIDLPWWYFAVSGLLALLIAWLTISFQSLKAALANPVDSLRNE
ncbi:MAG: ABC transporter permease [Bacteroidota bacterium]